MIFQEVLEGKDIRTGDIIATVDGGASLYGFLFKIIGVLIPGKPDHIVLYVGPDGLCMEAGPKGVNTFNVPGGRWNAEEMLGQRGIVDRLYGVGSLLKGRVTDTTVEDAAREAVRSFLLDQVGKPYNWDFFDPDREDAFYCSQLAYAAYKRVGINVNVIESGLLHPLFLERIVTPEEVWKATGNVP